MAKLTISMPDALDEYVTSRVEAGESASASEYLSELVRREQKRQEAAEKLRLMLDDAEASGVSELSAEEIWRAAEQRYLARNA